MNTGFIDWLPIINILGFLSLGSAYIFIQWRQGGNKAAADVITAYKEQVALNREEISKLNHELGIMQGQLKEKDERIKLLEQLVQNRNPDMIEFMKTSSQVSQNASEYMKHSSETLTEIKDFMKVINAKLDNGLPRKNV